MTRPLKRVMIADSFDIVRRGVKLLIESHDCYRVCGEASNGHEALAVVRETLPHIAIIDYTLPELNGLNLSYEIRKASPSTRVLIYTDHNRDDVILNVLRSGVTGFVLKSDPEHHLLAALDALSVQRSYFSGAISEVLLDRFLQLKPERMEGCLSHRERQIVQMIAEGHLNKQIAYALGISMKTVETHRASAMHKLNYRTTADLVRYAIRNNFTQA